MKKYKREKNEEEKKKDKRKWMNELIARCLFQQVSQKNFDIFFFFLLIILGMNIRDIKINRILMAVSILFLCLVHGQLYIVGHA